MKNRGMLALALIMVSTVIGCANLSGPNLKDIDYVVTESSGVNASDQLIIDQKRHEAILQHQPTAPEPNEFDKRAKETCEQVAQHQDSIYTLSKMFDSNAIPDNAKTGGVIVGGENDNVSYKLYCFHIRGTRQYVAERDVSAGEQKSTCIERLRSS